MKHLIPFSLLAALIQPLAAQPPKGPAAGMIQGESRPVQVDDVRIPMISPTARVEAGRIFASLCHDYAKLRQVTQTTAGAAPSLPAFDALKTICPIVERPPELQKYSCKNIKVPDLSTSGECADTVVEAVTQLISMCSDVKSACVGTTWQYSCQGGGCTSK